MRKVIPQPDGGPGPVSQALFELVSGIPESSERTSRDPQAKARSLATTAAMKAAGISGLCALPPGPLGLATVLPDLLAVWRVQRSLVADIAAAYGKTAYLKKETMIYCLFKHGSAALLRDLVVRAGERFLVRQAAVRTAHRILEAIGIKVTQRAVTKGLSRFIPVISSVGVGYYAYSDTQRVADTAIELFSNDITLVR
jgi:hypothetical protein